VEYICAPICSDRTVTGVVVTFMDITERKRAEQQIHALATTDSLTGIANRRAFMHALEGEVVRAHRYGESLALIMYDIDHFKQVNDTYGHDAGDDVLKGVARLVKSHVRATDLVARWGGEEFMVLVPQSDIAHARMVAEKLQSLIGAQRFDRVGAVTASFGVAVVEPHDDVGALLKKADSALYRAKEGGRNRVEASNGLAPGTNS
jgi:diguanylate cyclase (GGDEF)-like protein